jgi:hypothetical protein
MEVVRADGSREIHYSPEDIPLFPLVNGIKRRHKLRKHLKFMRAEDRQG